MHRGNMATRRDVRLLSVGERWIDAVEVRRHVAARRSMRGSRDLAIYVRRGVPAMTGERPPRDRGTGR
ncbi:hypothetical protein C7S16_6585 [Burkholderia thailandensis]|uniref:Uncharacterized protein n=2 Tax=Burkholderia thailandensis TaxID=57975 RepID=A0AAW9CIV0_BURTH|nr:hypothetical protein [Burkholderia thailandensis]MDW9250688.1 hypothetical protein [Burkholderia thailandensis]